MNLRITPSFNTQQIQNSRQNPNFGMHTIEPSVVQHITAKLGASIEDALVLVHPGSKLTREFNNLGFFTRRKLAEVLKQRPGIHYTHLDEEAIRRASDPVETARRLVQQATPITKEAVDKALSPESIQAVEAEIQALHQSNSQVASTAALIRSFIGEEAHLEAHGKDQRRLALLKLFGIN